MICTITIPGWERYNPRSDVKSSTWYRQSNNFFTDPDFYRSKPSTRLVWIFVLCQASQRIKTSLKINLVMASDQTGYTVQEIKDALLALSDIGCLEVQGLNEQSTRSDAIEPEKLPSATDGRTDEQTDTMPVSEPPASTPPQSVTRDDRPAQVITLLNNICLRQFKTNSKTNLRLASARLKDGFSMEDFATVFKHKAHEWSHDPKMHTFLRPETLLGSKFEGYLQAARSAPAAEETPGDIIRSLLPDELKDTGIPL